MDTALVLRSIQPLALGPVRAARAAGLPSGASHRDPSSTPSQAPHPDAGCNSWAHRAGQMALLRLPTPSTVHCPSLLARDPQAEGIFQRGGLPFPIGTTQGEIPHLSPQGF